MMLFLGGGRDHGEAVSGDADGPGAGAAGEADAPGDGVGADGPTSADAAAGSGGADGRGHRGGAPHWRGHGGADPTALCGGRAGGVAAGAPRPGARPKLGAKQQAFVVALACTKPPEGRERWTMQLLADRVVELQIVPDITDEAIRLLLKRTSSSRG